MTETVSLSAQKAHFLSNTACASWAVQPLAGDASSRSYDRLTGPDGQTAILMDAGPDAAQSIPPFVAIARHLLDIGLCPPQVLASEGQFLLLSDLGARDVAVHLRHHPGDEAALYTAACDVLHRIAAVPPPGGLIHLTPDVGAAMLEPFFDWFAPDAAPRKAAIQGHLTDALARHAGPPDTLSLRDYHAENLIWRGELTGTDRIGLLDFQDAFVAPEAYDLVSLLQDARRDVSAETCDAMLGAFAGAKGQSLDELHAACAVLGAQRNLRILGIFARLSARDGKPQYRALMPRVTGHIHASLSHPALARLRPLLGPYLPGVTA